MNGCKNHCGFDKGIELNSERKKPGSILINEMILNGQKI